ncbi:MAG TPA: hypothetical protein VNJ03_09565 [Vicinamibacterales bacterium]|nr:hypothetical protein [Vicinamibacterales bacterium]
MAKPTRTVIVYEEGGTEYGRADLINGVAELTGFLGVLEDYQRQGIPDFYGSDDGPRFITTLDGDEFLDQLKVEYGGMAYMAVVEE